MRCLCALLLALLTLPIAAGELPGIESVAVGEHRELRVNGEPFFPIMSWAQSRERFPLLDSLGFNTFCGSGGGRDSVLGSAAAVGGYVIVSPGRGEEPARAGHPRVLAYNLRDEPDLGIDRRERTPRNSAEEVQGWYEAAKASDPSRPVFLNYTASFMRRVAWDRPDVQAYYQATALAADILCFDIYPIYQKNRDDRLIWVADGVTELRDIAGPGKPVWAWIETSKGSKWITYERQKDVSAAAVRSEVWMAVIRGATGIGYFTHAWRPEFTEFAPTPEVREELQRTNGQLTRLAPVILSGTIPRQEPWAMGQASILFLEGLHGEVMTREYDGSLYVFANNLDMNDFGERRDDELARYRGGVARISVPGLQVGTTVEVVDEDRSVTAEAGYFMDAFSPLGVHIYRIAVLNEE